MDASSYILLFTAAPQLILGGGTTFHVVMYLPVCCGAGNYFVYWIRAINMQLSDFCLLSLKID
jgi:hypothetical protein